MWLGSVIDSIDCAGSIFSGVVSSAWSWAVPNSGVAACMSQSWLDTSSSLAAGGVGVAAVFISASSENMIDASALRPVELGAALDGGGAGGGAGGSASTGMEWLPDRRNRSCVAVASLARAPAKLGRLSRCGDRGAGSGLEKAPS